MPVTVGRFLLLFQNWKMDFFPRGVLIGELLWKILKILFLQVESKNHNWQQIPNQDF